MQTLAAVFRKILKKYQILPNIIDSILKLKFYYRTTTEAKSKLVRIVAQVIV